MEEALKSSSIEAIRLITQHMQCQSFAQSI